MPVSALCDACHLAAVLEKGTLLSNCWLMNKAKIKVVLNEHLKRLQRYYKAVFKSYGPERIHQFRLEYKKLRAFIRFVNTGVQKQNRLKLGSKIKAIYRKLGELRNYQLHRERMDGLLHHLLLPAPENYFRMIEESQKEVIMAANGFANDFSLTHFKQQLLENPFNPISTATKECFVQQKAKALLGIILLKAYTDEDLHAIRKILKDILYNKSLLASQNELLPPLFADWDYLENFAAQLGNYHDLCIALDLASHQMIVAVDNKAEQSTLNFLHKQLQWSKHKLAAAIYQQLALVKQNYYKKSAVEAVPV